MTVSGCQNANHPFITGVRGHGLPVSAFSCHFLASQRDLPRLDDAGLLGLADARSICGHPHDITRLAGVTGGHFDACVRLRCTDAGASDFLTLALGNSTGIGRVWAGRVLRPDGVAAAFRPGTELRSSRRHREPCWVPVRSGVHKGRSIAAISASDCRFARVRPVTP